MNKAIEMFVAAVAAGLTLKFEKFATIKARSAAEGEVIDTIIDGVKETTNTANTGDMVATGPKGEEYIIPAAKFGKLYEATTEDGIYKAKGVVEAMVVPADTPAFTFPAPWGEEMIAEPGDMICASAADSFDPEKVYRIEKGAFAATYRLMAA